MYCPGCYVPASRWPQAVKPLKLQAVRSRKFVANYLRRVSWPYASTVRVPFVHPDVKPDAAGCVGIEDIIYHVIRCSLIHSDEKDSKIRWNDAIALGLDQDGNLVLNNGLIWGLVSAVVFSPTNKDESVPDQYWLQVGMFRMFISELWGRIDLAKRFVKFHTGVDVP